MGWFKVDAVFSHRWKLHYTDWTKPTKDEFQHTQMILPPVPTRRLNATLTLQIYHFLTKANLFVKNKQKFFFTPHFANYKYHWIHFFFSFLLTNIFKLASVKYFYEVEATDTRQDGTIVLFETCRHLSDDIQKKYGV